MGHTVRTPRLSPLSPLPLMFILIGFPLAGLKAGICLVRVLYPSPLKLWNQALVP